MATQRLSPTYFKRLEKNYLAWVRQLGKATFFMTFSMPEGHWADILKILYRNFYKTTKVPSDDELLKLPYAEKSKLVKSDPVAIVRHFNKKFVGYYDMCFGTKVAHLASALTTLGLWKPSFEVHCICIFYCIF